MSDVSKIFGFYYYGDAADSKISIDTNSGAFKVGDVSKNLSLGKARIIALFIDAANKGERLSLKTLSELLDCSEVSLKVRLNYLRETLGTMQIAQGVMADALFLSDRLMGSLTAAEKAEGLEKKPYQFNAELGAAINRYGNNIPEDVLATIRKEPNKTLGRHRNPKEFKAALG